jgi:hypothetical protein
MSHPGPRVTPMPIVPSSTPAMAELVAPVPHSRDEARPRDHAHGGLQDGHDARVVGLAGASGGHG